MEDSDVRVDETAVSRVHAILITDGSGVRLRGNGSTNGTYVATRLHQPAKRWADSREFWGLAGVQALSEFMKHDADLWRKASADKGLGKSASYCVQQ